MGGLGSDTVAPSALGCLVLFEPTSPTDATGTWDALACPIDVLGF